MILWLKVNQVSDVRGSGPLRFTRITQARARRANCFVFPAEPVTVKRSYFEVLEKQCGAVIFLPLPIINGSQRYVEPEVLFGRRHFVVGVQCQRRCLNLTRQTTLDQRTQRRGKQQLSRRVRLERRANARPRLTPCLLRDAKLAGRNIEKRGANRLACTANGSQKHRLARLEQLRIDGSSGCNDAYDLTPHELLRLARLFRLFANRDPITFAHQSCNVIRRRVMWHPTHRHGIAALLVTRRQSYLQFTRASQRVIKKQLVEIAQTKKQ